MPSILILGNPADAPCNSVEVLTASLVRAFQRLGSWHVAVHDIRKAAGIEKQYDVALVHTWGPRYSLSAPIVRALGRITASFMEVPYSCDVRFVLLPKVAERPNTVCVPFPMPDTLTACPFTPADAPTVVLLDHPWPANIRDMNVAWWKILEPALERLIKTYPVKQLVLGRDRTDLHVFPGAEQLVPVPYAEYLAATADVTHFVMTHMGSYNMTTLDMAARGMVCMAHPTVGLQDHFAADGLGVIPVHTAEDVIDTIENATPTGTRPPGCRTMDETVAVMNRELRKRL